MKNYILLGLILSIIFCCSVAAKNITENEMKELTIQIVNVQIKTYNFQIINDIKNIVDKEYNQYDIERLKYSLNTSVDINCVQNYKEFNSLYKSLKILKIAFVEMRTWFIIAFGFDGSYYLLRNFDFNHFNNLIHQKIGRPKTINEYLDIGKLYINTVQFSDYGFRKVISVSEYHKLKKIHDSIAPPKLFNYKGDIILEFHSLQSSTNKVKHHKLIFNDGLIKNVEETPDDG